jgi:cellulose synthase/poly-beta-1,6-N-acetylglucosamine synthase-like glycosyltransferase
MEAVFWVSVLGVVHPWVLYPLCVALIGWLRPRPIRRAAFEPTVTILIPAWNEEDCIGATVADKLRQDYPREKLQIIVASDGSTDRTDDIVRDFQAQGVTLLRVEGRGGKAVALNRAMRDATGEIVVFSDANSLFAPDAVRRMVENFADPEVGYVTGGLRMESGAPSVSGEGIGAYLRYEALLRDLESSAGSVIGVNGGVDAIRRTLYSDIPANLITDFVLPLRVMAAGYRVVHDARARATETANERLGSEFRMRVRVALRALQGIAHMKRLLNPLRFPLGAFCLVSHKLLRYGAFLFMAAALASNAVLALHQPAYRWLLAAHLAGYALALLGLTRAGTGPLRALTVVPSYLLMTYAAFALATWKFLRGQSMATWKPRAG